MEAYTAQLCLKDLRVITGALQNIICKSFGPKGVQTLLMSNTGQMAVTHDGVSILSALHFSHPVAKVIVESVRSFGQDYGDGCKTIIIYIHELLSAIELNFAKQNFSSSDDMAYSNVVSRSLHAFTNNDLSCICNEMREFICIQNCKQHMRYCKTSENPIHCVIQTCLSGLPTQVGGHMADVVASFLSCIVEIGLDFHVVLKFLDNFLLVQPNQSYVNSQIRDGLFLQGRFFGQHSSTSCVRFIFMQCPLEGNVNKESTDAAALSFTCTESFFTYRTQVAGSYLQTVTKARVSLILTIHKVPDYILQMCYKLNINILTCLDMSDIELVTYMTGRSPVTNVYEDLTEDNIVTAASWENIVTCGKSFVNIVFDVFCSRCTLQTLFLCAPTGDLCEQLKMFVKKSVKVVQHCLSGSTSASFRESSFTRFNVCTSLNTDDVSSVLTSESQQLTTEISHTPDNGHVELFNSKHSLPILNNIIAGGGYFENILIYFLQCYAQKDISCSQQFSCRILMKMLEAVPKILHNNQLVLNSGCSCNFLCSQNEVMKAINCTVVSGVNSQAVLYHLESAAVDVLNIKFEVLFAAINLVVTLLRVDSIVGVKRLANEGPYKSDLEDDDDVE